MNSTNNAHEMFKRKFLSLATSTGAESTTRQPNPLQVPATEAPTEMYEIPEPTFTDSEQHITTFLSPKTEKLSTIYDGICEEQEHNNDGAVEAPENPVHNNNGAYEVTEEPVHNNDGVYEVTDEPVHDGLCEAMKAPSSDSSYEEINAIVKLYDVPPCTSPVCDTVDNCAYQMTSFDNPVYVNISRKCAL